MSNKNKPVEKAKTAEQAKPAEKTAPVEKSSSAHSSAERKSPVRPSVMEETEVNLDLPGAFPSDRKESMPIRAVPVRSDNASQTPAAPELPGDEDVAIVEDELAVALEKEARKAAEEAAAARAKADAERAAKAAKEGEVADVPVTEEKLNIPLAQTAEDLAEKAEAAAEAARAKEENAQFLAELELTKPEDGPLAAEGSAEGGPENHEEIPADKKAKKQKEPGAKKEKKPLGSSSPLYYVRIVGVLTAICLGISLLLAFVNNMTKDVIASNAEKERQAAILAVFPDGDEVKTYETESGETVYLVLKNGEVSGYCVSADGAGYKGPIGTMIGMTADGKVDGIKIVSSSETPGIGSKVAAESFLSRFYGMDEEAVIGENVDGVTGATFSSRGIADAVNQAILLDFDLAKAAAEVGAEYNGPVKAPVKANDDNGDEVLEIGDASENGETVEDIPDPDAVSEEELAAQEAAEELAKLQAEKEAAEKAAAEEAARLQAEKEAAEKAAEEAAKQQAEAEAAQQAAAEELAKLQAEKEAAEKAAAEEAARLQAEAEAAQQAAAEEAARLQAEKEAAEQAAAEEAARLQAEKEAAEKAAEEAAKQQAEAEAAWQAQQQAAAEEAARQQAAAEAAWLAQQQAAAEEAARQQAAAEAAWLAQQQAAEEAAKQQAAAEEAARQQAEAEAAARAAAEEAARLQAELEAAEQAAAEQAAAEQAAAEETPGVPERVDSVPEINVPKPQSGGMIISK